MVRRNVGKTTNIGGSEPLKKETGAAISSPDTKKSQIFLHARHRETNTKLGFRSLNATGLTEYSRTTVLIYGETSSGQDLHRAGP